ncbi:MAG: AIR synthase-related protein [Candidatus Pacebacteria bacterium]|nr:AIR synthase-related protein [Candidatus Paceibacterota bacterium]
MYNPVKPYKDRILAEIRKTWSVPNVNIRADVYPVIRKRFSLAEVDHTDGIGTKGIYHWQKRTFKNAVLDALAMNLNDLALVRAIPYKLQNHIFVPCDDQLAIMAIIKALSQECQKRKIAITGGETSIQNTMIGMDISLSVSGFVSKPKANKFRVGDVLLGIKSNGLHSNGFTKVREIFGKTFVADFVKPTAIYLDNVLELDRKFDIHGMMHITGGAFTKLKSLLPGANARINGTHRLKPQPIFQTLREKGIPDKEMYQTFNCGIGFMFSTSEKEAKIIASRWPNIDIVGRVARGNGKVIIDSMFGDQTVEF